MADTADDLRAIMALRDEWAAAVNARDVARILTLVIDDCVFLAPGAPPIRGKASVEALYKQVFSLYRIEQSFSFEEVQAHENWAYALGRDEITMTPVDGGEPVRAEGMGVTIMLKQADGSWRFARGLNNMTRQSNPAGQ
jgi:uncharacterized protein (TIGR02246 family)